MTLRPRLALSLAVALQAACTCHTESSARVGGAPAKAAPAKAEPGKPAPAEAKAPTAAPEAKAPEAKAPEAKAPEAKLAADAADPLGKRFVDPDWFRKEMLEGAKAMDVSRSERNEQGLFSSQILFELPAGTTSEQCADQLEAKVKGDVPNLTREPDAKAPGRLKLSGETQRYRVTMMCGEAKGVMRAYVGYEWLE
jgi:pyruvate/2-oxoglutarate dehydrogenase complex dihydrolipoamide acyltransferase (E2) component